MTDEEKIRKAFDDTLPKPQGAGKPGGPLKVSPATVSLNETQIKWAIDAYVAVEGYQVGKVTIACHPDQRNGPDTFTATVEVTPKVGPPRPQYE